MIELKTAKEIEEMKPAGRFVGEILKELKAMTKVGTNLLEIDEYVHKKIVDRKGAESCYVDYAPDFGTGPFRTLHLHVGQRRSAAWHPVRLQPQGRGPRQP